MASFDIGKLRFSIFRFPQPALERTLAYEIMRIMLLFRFVLFPLTLENKTSNNTVNVSDSNLFLRTITRAGSIEEEYPGWSRWLEAHDAERTGSKNGHTGADLGDHAMECGGERYPPQNAEVIIGNTARSARKLHWFEWTCFVQPKRPADAAVIASVAFILHPTFSPHRIVVNAEAARENGGRFAVTRRGWGTFQVGVEITDCNGHVSAFSHELSFASAETANAVLVEVGNITTNPTRAEDRTCTSPCGADESQPPRMAGVSEALMHGVDGVGRGWSAPLVTLMCDEEARPGYQSEKAHEYHDDNDTLHAKVRLWIVMSSLHERPTPRDQSHGHIYLHCSSNCSMLSSVVASSCFSLLRYCNMP